MQQILLNRLICTHREGEFPRWSCEPACSLNDSMSEAVEFFKCPVGGTLRKRSGSTRGCQHLDFPGQIVSHDSAKGEDLIPCEASGGEHIKGCICFGIAKDGLLGTPTIVELNDTLGRFALVGDNHFVVEVQVPRLEQVQLQRTFLLAFHFLADEQKTVEALPGLGFPLSFKIGAFPVYDFPAVPLLNHAFQLREPLKRDRGREPNMGGA